VGGVSGKYETCTPNPGETEGEKETNYSYCKTCKKIHAGEIPYCPDCEGIEIQTIEKKHRRKKRKKEGGIQAKWKES
jgi:hypothetical protein